MRKLATVQKIWKIEQIEGADRIELAHVLGWQCVINKGQFTQGDLGVYFEIDAFLPEKPVFEFLRSSSFRHSEILGDGFRLRTMRFCGQLSQGLILPVQAFEELAAIDVVEYADVTELLKIKKWEVPERVSTSGTIIGDLPPDIPKTDETRVQSIPELIQEFDGLPYYITTKMDGSSHSCCIDAEGVFHVTGHNYEYKDDGKSGFYEWLKDNKVENKLRKYREEKNHRTIALQGELCGEGIQKNRLKLKKPEWYVFTVRINGKRVGLEEMIDCCKEIGLNTVPIEERGRDLPQKYPDVDALLIRAEGDYPNGGRKEGIVIRPTEPVFSGLISGSLSMKVINNQYLLKESK